MNHNPRNPEHTPGPDHVRAALALRRRTPPTTRPAPADARTGSGPAPAPTPEGHDQRHGARGPLTARQLAIRDRPCPHCHAARGDPCTALGSGLPLPDVHPSRLAADDPGRHP